MQRQALFFEQKEGTLLPLTMRDVAQELGLHESTISRAVNGKYMQTPWGVYELRYFFQRGLWEGNFGGTVTEFTVKRLIQQIIEAEDGHNPYPTKPSCASWLSGAFPLPAERWPNTVMSWVSPLLQFAKKQRHLL